MYYTENKNKVWNFKSELEEDMQVNFSSVAQEMFFAHSGQRVLALFQHRFSHLDRASHGAQGKNRCTVFDSGLAIKGTLGIHE